MMRAPLRALVALPKRGQPSVATWRPLPVPPRFTPFLRGLRGGADWRWRSMEAEAGDHRFHLLATVNIRLGQFRAWLLDQHDGAWRLLARLEDHASHPGLHMHAWCPDLPQQPGPPSIDAPLKLPRRGGRRTAQGRTSDVFWGQACATFNIATPMVAEPTQGRLL